MARQSGSALIWTLCVITVLSLIAAQLLEVVSSKYHNALHTATWQESLLAAESGVDLAIAELRKSLYPAPNYAWQNWNNTPGNGVTSYGISTVPNAGLVGTPMTIEVNVDAPLQLKDPANSWQYYRVRATGTMPLIGPARAADNKQDTRLRKVSLQMDRFTNGILTSHQLTNGPIVARRVEAIVRPASAFDLAIMAVGALDLTDQNIIIDSYDSRDTAKSTNGLYDVTKRQQNGSIATDGTILNAGNAHVYGDVATNSGTVSGVANVTGIQRDDFYQEPIPIAAPSWPSVNATPSLVSGTATLAASSTEGSAASRYVLSSVTMSGNQTLTLTGNADGSPSYVEIYVSGDVNVTGNASVVLNPGVRAKIYFAGNVSIAGNGVVNTNNKPGDLQLYGITPPAGTVRNFAIGGNSQLSAAVYAPGFDVQVNNGGTRGSVYGSFVGKTVKMNGVTDLHYDEALGASGLVNNYKIVSWFEDNR
ncbi:MAG: hypothetical protein M3Y69_08765 [Verrucomicrobiota bacterium]|nr:hypothetical protein [Verrucomicrobiota bacterium]